VVHMDMDQFMALMRDAKPAHFAYRMQGILF
jgi:Ala-tRNA(Pro) deacylase